MTRRTTRSALATLALLLATTATACGDDGDRSGSLGSGDATESAGTEGSGTDDATDASDDGDASDDTTDDTSDEPGTTTRVVLDDEGEGDLEELRLVVEEGASQQVTMTMRMQIELTLDGKKAPPTTVPVMVMEMDVDVTEVDDDGSLTVRFDYTDARVEGAGAADRQLESAFQPLEDVSGTFRVTSRGVYLGGELDHPEDLPAMLEATMGSIEGQLANMVTPYPEEPVGPGAEWTVHTAPAINGIESEFRYHYRLVERRGDRVVLDVDFVQESPAQEVEELPGAPAGASMSLESMRGEGAGRVDVDLRALMPTSSRVESTSTMRASVTDGTRSQDMVQEMELTVQVVTND